MSPFLTRQMIEVAKAASEQTKVLILDESTAALTENEIEQLFAVMRKLAQRGVSIIFISHRIEEVFTISDRITVMRDGEAVSTIDRAHADRKKLLSLMVGRDFSETYPEKENVPGEVVLEAAASVEPSSRTSPSPSGPGKSWAWRVWSAPAGRRSCGRFSARTG